MKSNIKKKSKYGISMLTIALILMMIPTGLATVSADRTIENNTLTVGNSTNVTVVINNNGAGISLSLKESIPSGWILTKGIDDASDFKPSTNEWVWFSFPASASKTVIYKITVPSKATAGDYNINGVTIVNGSTTNVTGDSIITVVNNTVIPPVKGSFEFTVSPSSSIVNVGENALYTLTVSNTGTTEDTYILGVSNSNNNITANVDKKSITVGAGNSSTVNLTVKGSSIGSYIVDVTATPAANGSNVKSVTTKTDVVITPATPEGFNLVVDSSSKTVVIGASATYTLTVSNTGSVEDTYDIVADKPKNATVSLDKNNVTVGAGNNSEITMLVNGSVTGTYTVGVKAISQANVSNVKNVTTTTNVVSETPTSPPSRSGSSGGGGSSGGTYPTFTATPAKPSNETASPTVTVTTIPTVTTTVVRPTSAIAETPVDMTTKKGSPGFEIIVAIGMFAIVYILRRTK